MTKRFNLALGASIFMLLLFSCGGGSHKLTSELANAQSGTRLEQDTGRLSHAAAAKPGYLSVTTDSNRYRLSAPADPWALPNLPQRTASAAEDGAAPTMAQLEQALADAFRELGINPDKVAAAAPSGTDNATFDLVAEADGSDVELTWTERMVGDYDQNGEVGITDLTPIGVRFNNTVNYDDPSAHGGITYWPTGDPDGAGADNWRAARVDGDSNTEINISDITPISAHYRERMDGFRVYRRGPGDTQFSLLPNPGEPGSAFTIARPTIDQAVPVRYSFTDDDPPNGSVEYYVVAYDDVGDNEGPESNQATVDLSEGPTVELDATPTSGPKPLTVDFTATATDDDGTIEKYEFDFGEGGGYEDYGTTNTAQHVYNTVGTFNARVRVTDNDSNTGTDTVAIESTGIAPEAQLTVTPDSGEEPLTVTCDGSGSSDTDGTIVKYEFDFDQGDGYEDFGATDSVDHGYASDGSYTVRLRVTDNDGLTDTDEKQVTVTPTGALLPPAWYEAKTNVGLDTATMGTDDNPWWPDGMTADSSVWPSVGYEDMFIKMPIFHETWWGDPEGFPQFAFDKSNLLQTTSKLQDMLLAATDEFQPMHQIEAQTHTETLDPTDPLAVAIAAFVDDAGGTSNVEAYKTALAPLSLAAQQAIAPVVYAAIDARALRQTSLDAWGIEGDVLDDLFDWAHGAGPNGLWSVRTAEVEVGLYLPYQEDPPVTFWRHYDYASMFEGAALLADAIDDLTLFLQGAPAIASVNLDVDTPVGKVTIGGTGSDTHNVAGDGNGHALLIDLGGDDTYNCHAGGTASGANGIAVCLDFGGADVYNRLDDPDDVNRTTEPSNDNTSQQGAGRLGVGILVDYDGQDEYHSVRVSQGCGILGVGLLADYGSGNDTYEFEALGQGGAMGGVGILHDEGGGDSYDAWQFAQGYGGLQGVGFLVDQGTGVDDYYAEPLLDASKPEYGTDVYDDRNMSNCQGAAWGSRWGWIVYNQEAQDHYVVASGGLGLLFDGGGDDTYTSGVFGQGSGFFEGIGVLIDQDGDDVHTGYWYSQGTTAHVAAAGLWDGGGNDTYTNSKSVGIGGAHDMSVTWFLERAGNDSYDCSNLDLGTGNINGMGYFIDYEGDDEYLTHESCDLSLGRGHLSNEVSEANDNLYREDLPTYGIFVDVAGLDTYDADYLGMLSGVDDSTLVDPLPGNNAAWLRYGYPNNPTIDFRSNEYGSGIDDE